MNTKEILAALRADRSKLDKAIAAIEALAGVPMVSTTPVGRTTKDAVSKPKKRVMSAAGRRRIAEAQSARWAAKKDTAKSPDEGRKPLEACAAKGRWPRASNARKVGKP